MENISVLICDDSATVREQLKDTLKLNGITSIYEACDGEEAIEICHVNQPHLVFMDIIMPKMDGIAALKEIHQRYPSIKVIMASSTSGLAHLKKSKLLGAYTFIQKPISELAIKEVIEKYLDEKSDQTFNV
ncbi:response regulator transcription factor [Evansella cellulosilytica]|uniref:Response regulator receiver protein n=1 Tax=Evansella cellulosilytica (strain ATCC 21833 / DSM 2522 / FERM P-1141 / JCM 9156 / N-4) TaxID=649639 RepID=E6TTK8_EVAC2|nr:response regulator [Evansella cellulosilytica]ADU29644.1 response regulator receiver protein [Evansella cellulosilytica DSM 2522]